MDDKIFCCEIYITVTIFKSFQVPLSGNKRFKSCQVPLSGKEIFKSFLFRLSKVPCWFLVDYLRDPFCGKGWLGW